MVALLEPDPSFTGAPLMPQPKLLRTWHRAWIVSLVLVILVLLAGGIAEFYLADGRIKEVIFQLLSTLLGIGVIALLYDVWIRSSYTSELIDVMKLAAGLVDAGITQVCPESKIDWAAIYQPASRIRIAMADAATLAERDWTHILDASRDRAADVQVYLPDPDSTVASVYAEHLQHDLTEFKSMLGRTAASLESGWKNALQGHPRLHPKSKLRIHLIEEYLGVSYVFVDEGAVVLLPQLLRREHGQGRLAIRFESTSIGIVGSWLASQRRRLEERSIAVPYYESPNAPDKN